MCCALSSDRASDQIIELNKNLNNTDFFQEDKAQNTKLFCPYNIPNYMAGQM
jgi:hypothetical protein